MAIIVDYRCTVCGLLREAFVDSPAPPRRPCVDCGGESVRRWSPVGIISRRQDKLPVVSQAKKFESLCAANPDVPGLCHMSPSAGRAWVARYRRDNRALDAELARQETAAAISPPTMADAITHTHSHHTDIASVDSD